MRIEDMKNKQLSMILPKHKEDLSGKVFGRLVVLNFNYYNRHYFWLCKCECGDIVSVREDSLLTNNTRSCGCLQRDTASSKRYHDYPAAFNNLYATYRHSAEIRNIVFDLSREFMFKMTQQICHYCGSKPTMLKKTRVGNQYLYNGLDRLNPKLGYTEDNVVSCCKICNMSKRVMSEEEFKDWINKVYNYININTDVKEHIA